MKKKKKMKARPISEAVDAIDFARSQFHEILELGSNIDQKRSLGLLHALEWARQILTSDHTQTERETAT